MMLPHVTSIAPRHRYGNWREAGNDITASPESVPLISMSIRLSHAFDRLKTSAAKIVSATGFVSLFRDRSNVNCSHHPLQVASVNDRGTAMNNAEEWVDVMFHM